MNEAEGSRNRTASAGSCCVPNCPNPEDVRVLGYQSGLEQPDCGDRYPLCGPHYQEYREKNTVNIGWLERMGVRMRPIRYCITPDCGNPAYNNEEESRAEPNDGTGETPLCWPCFLEATATGARPERRNSS